MTSLRISMLSLCYPKGRQSPGDSSAGATPVPIPNTAVKPCSADDTTPWESRTSPGPCLSFYFHRPYFYTAFFDAVFVFTK